jgi:hypothetical protein
MDQLRQQIDYLVDAKRKVEMEMEMEMEVKEPRRPQDLHTHTGTDYSLLDTSLNNDAGTSPFN